MHENAFLVVQRPPDTLGHAKGRPGEFLIDLGSFWSPFLELFGDPLRPSCHPPSQQACQRRQRNGLELPTMWRSCHKLSFRTALGGHRAGFDIESSLNSTVLARCQCRHFGIKNRPGDALKWAFWTPFRLLGAPLGTFWWPGRLPKPIRKVIQKISKFRRF